MIKSKIKGLNRSTQNTGTLGRFVEFLTYKAELVGKKIIKIDESYTSKTCYNCGKKHEMKLYTRIMECDCGNNIDRDKNSAVNIRLRFLSQNGLWTAYQQFVGNLRQTVPSLEGVLVGSPRAIARDSSLMPLYHNIIRSHLMSNTITIIKINDETSLCSKGLVMGYGPVYPFYHCQ